MRKVNIDLDKYMVYEDEAGDFSAAVDIKHQNAMNYYYRNFDHFKSAPDKVTIEGYEIIPDQEPNSYTIDKNQMKEFRVNELRGTWVRKGR